MADNELKKSCAFASRMYSGYVYYRTSNASLKGSFRKGASGSIWYQMITEEIFFIVLWLSNSMKVK